jgi:branched-chain amino acid transport system substrate-binding protein
MRLSVAGAGVALALLAAGAPAADDEILIGGALCLTGIQAPLDEPGLKGAEVAVKSDPVTVGNVTVQLINEGARLIVAPCDFDFGSPASREAQKAGIVGISTCASSPLYSAHSLGDRQFTLSMWNTTMGATAAEYAVKDRGWKKAYVVTDQFIDYTKSLSRYFIQHFKTLGGKVLLEDKYTQGEQDFSAQLARLKALPERPDVLFISSYMPDLGTIIRAIREVGIDTPIVGGDSYDDPGLFGALGERFGNEVYFVTHTWTGPEAGPEMQRFLELYQRHYGAKPDTAFVATGWDTIMLMARAVQLAGSTDGAAVARALEDNQFELLTGKLDYRSAAEGHMPDKSAVVAGVRQGKPYFVGWRRPENPPPP